MEKVTNISMWSWFTISALDNNCWLMLGQRSKMLTCLTRDTGVFLGAMKRKITLLQT